MTPVDYESEGFKADHSEEVPMPSGAYRVSLGRVRTTFHGLKVKLAAREQGSSGGYVNNTYQASDTESPSQLQQDSGEFSLLASQDLTGVQSQGDEASSQPLAGEESSQMSQIGISSPSSPASTISLTGKKPPVEVSCVCLSTSLDALMLQCSSCSTSQHAACSLRPPMVVIKTEALEGMDVDQEGPQ